MLSRPGLIYPDSTGIFSSRRPLCISSRREARLLAETSLGAASPERGAVSAASALERLRRQAAEQENRQPEGILLNLLCDERAKLICSLILFAQESGVFGASQTEDSHPQESEAIKL